VARKFKKRPDILAVVLPGRGRIASDAILEGDDLALFVPALLVEVPDVPVPPPPAPEAPPLVEPVPEPPVPSLPEVAPARQRVVRAKPSLPRAQDPTVKVPASPELIEASRRKDE
jgi:hypothetical protein